MKEHDDFWHDASEWLMDNHCVSCKETLRCEMDCPSCEKITESLAKVYRENRKDTLEELLPLFEEELKQVQGGGYEGEMAIETCMDIVKKKLELCS